MSSDSATVIAKQFLHPRGRIVDSAARLADEVTRQLESHETISIDLRGMRGLSSSYFNLLLQRVMSVTTPDAFSQRVTFLFDSAAQEQVYQRCLDFARRTVA
jgi:hypothetical protein